MKIYKLLCYILFSSIGLTSCSDSLIEKPQGRIDETFLQTETGLNSLVVSQYFQCRLIIENMRYFGVFPSDITTFSLNSNDVINLSTAQTNIMPALPSVRDIWRDLYNGINNVNFGIQVLNEKSFNGSDILLGELSFFRAWYYHLIVETWGEGAHFTTTPTQSVVTEGYQTTIDEFYRLILSDLDVSISNLQPTTSTVGKITQGAAKALKSRVLLSLASYESSTIQASGFSGVNAVYEETKRLAADVIGNYNYSLLPEFSSVFSVENENNAEVIWAIQFTENEKFNTNGHGLHRYWVGNYNRSARTGQVVPRMYGHSIYYGREYRHIMMTRYFLKLFNEQEDTRLDGTIQTVWRALWDTKQGKESDYGIPFKDGKPTDTVLFKPLYDVDEATALAYEKRGIAIDGLNHIYDKDGVPFHAARSWHHTMTKYLDPSRLVPKQETSHKDVIVMRLAELYLIMAEAEMKLGNSAQAAKYIDQLRVRSRKKENSLQVKNTDIDIDYILDERARELGGEMHRWFDLKRTKKLLERVKKYNPDAAPYINETHYLRPIPQIELDNITNRETFKQNPGYPTKL